LTASATVTSFNDVTLTVSNSDTVTDTAATTLDPETTTVTVVASVTAAVVGCSNPGVCSKPKSCIQEGLASQCYCFSLASGTSLCGQLSSCTKECTSNDACGPGNTCVTSTCCTGSGSNCKPNSIFTSCANTASAKMLFRSRIRAVAGYVLWEDGTYGPPTPLQ
jgi:hypothetical protein